MLCSTALLRRRRPAAEKKRHEWGPGPRWKDRYPPWECKQTRGCGQFFSWPLYLKKKRKKKKWSEETHSVFLLVSVIAAALWISFPIKIAINHFEQAGWFHEEFDLVNWRCVLQGSYTKLRLTSAVVRQLAYGVLVCIIVLNHEE